MPSSPARSAAVRSRLSEMADLVTVALLLLALAAAGGMGFVVGREAGIAKGWRDARELLSAADETDEAGA